MRRALLSVTLLVAIAALPIRAQETFKGPELFPFGNFNTWTYRVQGQDDRDRLSVTSFIVSDKSGDRIYRFEARFRNQTVVTEHLAVRADGLYRVRHDNVELDPPLLICRLPPGKGQKWQSEYKINDQKRTVSFECDFEEMSVIKNPKMTVLVVRAEIADPKGTITNTCWYAPKYGLVKQVVQERESRIVIELDNFVGGKKGPPKMPGP